jgi:hypothetical protein
MENTRGKTRLVSMPLEAKIKTFSPTAAHLTRVPQFKNAIVDK